MVAANITNAEVRRIFLGVVGLSPQVVTEALYALAVLEQPPFVPDEIVDHPEFGEAIRAALAAGVPRELRVVGIQVGPFDLPPVTLGSSVVAYGTPALYAIASKTQTLQSSIDSVLVTLRRGVSEIAAFVAGVKIGSGRRSDSRNPVGSFTPQTFPVC